MSYSFKLGRPEDDSRIISLGFNFYEESALHDVIPLDKKSWCTTVRRLLRSPDGCVALMCHKGQPVGMCGLLASRHFLNRGFTVVHEMFLWVEPEYRSKKQSDLFVKEIKKQAKDRLNGDLLILACLENVRGVSVGRWYRSLGLKGLDHSYYFKL